MKTETTSLFGDLAIFDCPLPQEELRLLSSLPFYGDSACVQEVDPADQPICRRLEKRGLVRIERQKNDPVAMRPTWYAGRLQ